ncbi:MAG: HAD-IIIA family hydrolase [Selenomonadaceae bacterium]|nr:HAD-IIIA family hydrolase [Selenomonadaceae bacterium]
MAGGRGTRLASKSHVDGTLLPKPLVPVDGIPILEREIMVLCEQNFTDIVITVSYLGEAIREYFGDGSGISSATGDPFGVRIEYFEEEQPLGNAGALMLMREEKLTEDFLLLNADLLFDVDLHRLVDFHRQHQALATLLVHANDHPYDSGLLVCDENHRVKRWLTKEDVRPVFYSNCVNAGIHVLSPKVLDMSGIDSELIGKVDDSTGKIFKVDLDRHILKPLEGQGSMYVYDSPEYVRDMGTPERLEQADIDVKSGLVSKKSLRNIQRAIFLDRDGTINKYKGYLTNEADFELLPGAAEAVRKINLSGYLCIVITNQPAVARGEMTIEDLNEIHRKMETLLGEQGAYVDGIYYCPHHPDKGFPGEIQELKMECSCRKPNPGLLRMAADKYNIDLSESWMIGDSWRDIECGKQGGTHTCELAEDEIISTTADMVCKDLLEAVDKIMLI